MQQSQADVVQPLNLAGVVAETLERAAADIPRTHQATLDFTLETTEQHPSAVFRVWSHPAAMALQLIMKLLAAAVSQYSIFMQFPSR